MDNLPPGLVSTSGKVPAELDNINVVNIEDIVQLWKAYSANPFVHEGGIGLRLQNFFWRIWSSEHLHNSMPGSRLATLFMRISEPGSFTAEQLNKKPATSPPSSLKRDKPSSVHPSSGAPGKAPLPPILKKSSTSTSHGESHKTTRLLLTDPGGQSVTRKPSNPPTPVPTSRPALGGDSANRQVPKKAFVVSSKAKSAKRRPVVVRRKSSQQSPVASSTQCSTRAQSPEPVPSPLMEEYPGASPGRKGEHATKEPMKETVCGSADKKPNPTSDKEQTELPMKFVSDLKELLKKKTPTPPIRTFTSKSSPPPLGFFSYIADREFSIRHLSQENYERQPSTSSLVDKNFRKRFAEMKRQDDQHQVLDASSLHTELLSEPGLLRTESTTSNPTTETTSPSRFGDSHGEISTVATSIPNTTDHSAANTTSTDAFSTSGNVTAPFNEAGSLYMQSPMSLSRGPSQLSLLFGQSGSHSGN